MAVTVIPGDCRVQLQKLNDGIFNTCVTSPPYFGLRDYGTGTWEGGDPNCDHSSYRSTGEDFKDNIQGTSKGSRVNKSFECHRCGAKRVDSQIGLEESPEDYVQQLVAVFREVRRVLRDDGTLWLNLGDSYYNYRPGGHERKQTIAKTAQDNPIAPSKRTRRYEGIKEKDLIGIPWMVAFALRADGWYLRQDNIWHKPNPMPESVEDRTTRCHEYMFMFSKSQDYYYDFKAIRERAVMASGKSGFGGPKNNDPEKAHSNKPGKAWEKTELRNKRSVWTVATSPFADAHFATFPPDLIIPCILAGAPEGGHILDPFGGSGTTGLVADRLRRHATLIELNPSYVTMADNRIQNDAPLLAVAEAPSANQLSMLRQDDEGK